ncbi:hypothetical protein CFK37_04365 [Virgibacillus phasianinus]|uniref:Intracellular proteinase inhibitor BsuPI domain-containing protein n=1 Tax=Virgibacillus phasianinus TaxID=2017483 RepID=A0A220U0S0_9BACI|nr:BsuPI-related putative proteinase inhibitor [Virgibacillus phasianinus]ASK61461.1 hypothetical protein CFK37_04365 [Virgibacillus phasianinus]
MSLFKWSFVLIVIITLAACGQQSQENKDDDKSTQEHSNDEQAGDGQNSDSSVPSGGIVAGELEATLQVEGGHATFKVKNQTEQVKELILAGKNSYEYTILNENGKKVYQNSKSKPQYEQKHPITLKQAEEIEYELAIPDTLKQGTYTITAVLYTEPVLKAKTTFTVKK